MAKNDAPTASKRSLAALDCLNMTIGDVIGGIGPYLGAHLKATAHWQPADIGTAISAMGLATIAAQIPAGALIDRAREKRLLIAFSATLMSLSCVSLCLFTKFPIVIAAQIVFGIGAALAGPAIVAVSLGLVGARLFPARIARNEALNHLGNVLAALLAAAGAYFFSSSFVFYLMAVLGLLSAFAVMSIKGGEINNALARGADTSAVETSPAVSHARETWSFILSDKRILAFALSVFLFHLANAAMLPLAGQYLAASRPHQAPLLISACIVAAQLIMIPVSLVAGRLAQSWGRKPVFLLGFAALPLRALLFTISDSPNLVLPVQMLDGIGAGIFGVLVSVIVADLTQGTGHYNTTRGAIITAQGTGAMLSNFLAGLVVQAGGYRSGFFALAACAAVGLLICYIGLPETLVKTKIVAGEN
ncbi:MAG: MFS transporter [Cyanobacteria bacterium SZAS TMP-1]|nr:MFS transporter [Cyanobacteria bacterium SZAS TMP-1]